MLCQSAVLMVAALLTADSAIEVVSVRIRDKPQMRFISPTPARVRDDSHSTDLVIYARLRLFPGETIPRKSVWVHETRQKITLCYQIDHDPDLESVQRTVQLSARVKGMLLDDPRPVEASVNCGIKPIVG